MVVSDARSGGEPRTSLSESLVRREAIASSWLSWLNASSSTGVVRCMNDLTGATAAARPNAAGDAAVALASYKFTTPLSDLGDTSHGGW